MINATLENTENPSKPENVEQVVERIKSLLQSHIAEQGHTFSEPITDNMSFDYIGLDSLARVNLLSALDKEFAVSLDPTAAYDFVTVRALAEFVWSEVSGCEFDVRKVMGI